MKNPGTLKELKELRSVIGKFNYYSKYIKNHAEIIAPLTNLVKGHANDIKNATIILKDEALHAIRIMKSKLTEAPLLAFPKFYLDFPFIVTSTARFLGLGYLIYILQT